MEQAIRANAGRAQSETDRKSSWINVKMEPSQGGLHQFRVSPKEASAADLEERVAKLGGAIKEEHPVDLLVVAWETRGVPSQWARADLQVACTLEGCKPPPDCAHTQHTDVHRWAAAGSASFHQVLRWPVALAPGGAGLHVRLCVAVSDVADANSSAPAKPQLEAQARPHASSCYVRPLCAHSSLSAQSPDALHARAASASASTQRALTRARAAVAAAA